MHLALRKIGEKIRKQLAFAYYSFKHIKFINNYKVFC